jgi:hypothetical protein
MPIKESLNANPVMLGDIFSNGKRYVIPPFQRDYAWTISEWEELWDDILKLQEAPNRDTEHYLGAIVLQHSDGERRVIDGQQRLVTLSLLALAVIGHIEALIRDGHEVENNQHRVRLLREKFVSTQNAASLQYHPRLKLNDHDNPFYATYLVQGKTRRGLKGSTKRLDDALNYYRAQITQHFGAYRDGATLATFLEEVIAKRLRFIEIIVDDDETAFTVFETLNARGIVLGTADLLKNYLFQIAAKGGTDLDQAQLLWQQTIELVPLEQISTMLFHGLSGRVPNLREKRVFTAVKQQVPQRQGVFDFLRELQETAEIYTALDDPLSAFWHSYPGARVEVGRIKLLGMTESYPLILAALPTFDQRPARLANLLRRIISVGVRAWIARINPGDLLRAYQSVALQVTAGTCKSPQAMADALHAIQISDERFHAAFEQVEINPKGPHKKALRYLLSALEAAGGGQAIDFNLGQVNIEHVLPERPGDQWPAFSPEDHRRDLNRLGNLTPLENSITHTLGAKGYAEKRAAFADSALVLPQSLAEAEVWSPTTLRARQARMATLAVQVWSMSSGEGRR